MKKLLSVLLASALAVGAMCFTATAADTEPDVSFAPTETVIEVEPGQKQVEVDYKYTKNNGWAVMTWLLKADQKVISFNPYDEDGSVATDLTDIAYSVLEKNSKGRYVNLSITPNLFGSPRYNPSSLGTNESLLLIEGASVSSNDTTAAGEDFLALYINIADDTAPGDYVLSIYTENETKSNNINIDKQKINVTIDPVTIRVKGSDTPTTDSRLNVSGAQIRVPAQGSTTETQGLRFISTLDKSFYETLNKPASASDTGLGFGTVVFPTKLLADGELLTKETVKDGKSAAVVPAVKLWSENDTVVTYTACMTGIIQDAEALTTAYTVVPYATYTDGDKEVTVYGAQYSTTVFDIAKAAFDSKTESEYVNEYLYNEILNKVDPTTYNEPQKWSNIYKPKA